MDGMNEHPVGGSGGDVVLLHQGGQIIGGEVIHRQPHQEDDEPDDEDMYGQKLPEESDAQAQSPFLIWIDE